MTGILILNLRAYDCTMLYRAEDGKSFGSEGEAPEFLGRCNHRMRTDFAIDLATGKLVGWDERLRAQVETMLKEAQ